MKNGVLINIFFDLMIGLISLIFIYSLYKKYGNCNAHNRPTHLSLMLFWGMICSYFFIDTIQQLMAIWVYETIPLQLHIASLIPFTLLCLPIVFIIIYIISGNKYVGAAVSSVFLIFGFLYIYTTVQMDHINIIPTSWGYIITSNNNIANIIFLSGLFIVPTGMILGLLALIFLNHIPPVRKHKICISFLSISMVYDFLLLSAFSQTGEMMIASKIFIFVGVFLGYLVNFPPQLIESKYFPNIAVAE
jgi:hypothetical protein